MTKEELKKTIDIVTGIDIHSEAEATAKEELMSYAEQLQQENRELKEQYSKLEDKYFKNIPCCNEDDCALYKDYLNDKEILTEFEKWLEEEMDKEEDCWYGSTLIFADDKRQVLIEVYDKLQELKGVINGGN